jgi:bifunctional UDP-N-acetylglucosamine pyrophosphorylase/glucosamine-1-phosphate N-acetyltransferase
MGSTTPKALLDLCGRPLALWPVHAALEAGAAQVVVVDSPAAPLAPLLPPGVLHAVQPQPNGTGGAVAAALPLLDKSKPVLVLCGDVPLVEPAILEELLAFHDRSHAAATVLTTTLSDPSGYGRVVRDGEGLVARIVETKRPGDATEAELAIEEINAGIYVFAAQVLAEVIGRLDANNAQRELYLTQAIELLRAGGKAVAAYRCADPRVVAGVNDRLQLAAVRALARQLICERHLQAGVEIVDPATTTVEVGVRLEPEARVEPFTILRGESRVASGAVVGPFTTITDSLIGERAVVRASWLERANVGAGAQVGPYAYLRPGTVLAEGAKAGTFVELKATELGPGAKVPHLSYVGDATVGSQANLGAATITANYDGFAKHRTTIGPGARLGVDTTLVAPVRVGAGAYTGAGSVITEDVPDGALAIARARQRNLPGWAQRRREGGSEAEGEGKDAPAEQPATGKGL